MVVNPEARAAPSPADGAETALRIRVEGAGGPAPDLDAVGFVAGEPRCDGTFDPPMRREAPFMGVCRYR